MGYKIQIEEGPQLPFGVDGFTGRRNAHRHLFKHVIRICEQSPDDARASEDPEAWSEIIPDPPLRHSLETRRSKAIKELESISSCKIEKRTDIGDNFCQECDSEGAIASVDSKFQGVLAAYESAGRDAFMWALENPSRHGPRWVVFRSERETMLIKVLDGRRVKAIGMLDPDSGVVRIISCYRTRKQVRFIQRLFHQNCERAGYKKMGLLVNIQVKKVS